MSAPRYRPRRRLRSDLLPLLSVASLAFVICCLFPSEALDPCRRSDAADSPAQPSAHCAFITLGTADESAALAAARASWQADSRRTRRMAEMLPRALPEFLPAPALELTARPASAAFPRTQPRVRLLPPTQAAAAPVRIAAAPLEPAAPAFPREQMLRLVD